MLRELYETLDERDRGLCRQSLFVGLEMREDAVEYREGDLLGRNIIGTDPQTGSMSIGASPRQWQVVRFLCNGEIGPVGGATFLHGYTSSFGLFREKAL